jgi:hypothetical protein
MRQFSRFESIVWPGFLPIRTALKQTLRACAALLILLTAAAVAQNQQGRFVLERKDRTIVLEPYADNIVRVTLSTAKPAALAAPGYGIVGTPSIAGWAQERDQDGYDVLRSGRLVIRVAPENLPPPRSLLWRRRESAWPLQ